MTAVKADIGSLAGRVASLDLADIADSTIDHATRVIADTIGVIMGGSIRPEIQALVGSAEMGEDFLGARILAPGLRRVSPFHAAFVNATAGTFDELDEGYRPTGHPAIHVIPAVLAVAEVEGRSGAEVLTAVVAGYEIAARLFDAFQLTFPVHPHGHFGAIGAALGVDVLRGGRGEEAALIAATLPLVGTWDACFEGATARQAYAGLGAGVGVLAADLARAGFTGSRSSQAPLFGSLLGTLARPDVLTAAIQPTDLRILRNYVKFHSTCALSHSALDAILEMGILSSDSIRRVEVDTVVNNLKIDRFPELNSLSTRFSLQYAVAAAIVKGRTDVAAFEPDAEVLSFAHRVVVRASPDLEASWPADAPARVTVIMDSGERRTRTVTNPIGHHSRPAPPDALRRKFASLSWASNTCRLYDRLVNLRYEPDMAQLLDVIEPNFNE